MRFGTRHVLPAVQMVLAVVLLWWSARWGEIQRHLQDMPGPAPGMKLLFALNAPVVPLRGLWSQILPPFWDNVTMVIAIGLFWYWVARNIDSWREHRKACMFSQLPLRLVSDGILVCNGVFLMLVFISEVRWLMLYASPIIGWLLLSLPLCWSLVLILFFTRDFSQGVRRYYRGTLG